MRFATDWLAQGTWLLDAEVLALMVVVPIVQLACLDVLHWFRGRGL